MSDNDWLLGSRWRRGAVTAEVTSVSPRIHLEQPGGDAWEYDNVGFLRGQWEPLPSKPVAVPEPVPFVASRPELGAPPDPHLARMAAAAGAGLEAVGIHGGVQEPAPPDDEHPAPWRWNGEGELLDANGATVMFEDNECAFESSPRVRAIIEAGGEWPAVLRRVTDELRSHLESEYESRYDPGAARKLAASAVPEAEALLKRIDEAR